MGGSSEETFEFGLEKIRSYCSRQTKGRRGVIPSRGNHLFRDIKGNTGQTANSWLWKENEEKGVVGRLVQDK